MITGTPYRAIETYYAGCRFRSRLEARWAVAFDALGERWQYEDQGWSAQDSRDGRRRYLPDFYLPERRIWLEVKGTDEALGSEWDDLLDAVDPEGGIPFDPDGAPVPAGEVARLLICGPIPGPTPQLSVRAGFLLLGQVDDRQVVWHCDLLGNRTPVLADLTSDQYGCLPAGCLELTGHKLEANWRDEQVGHEESRRINHALATGRSARFEYGDRPAVAPWRAGEPQPW